MPQNESPGLHLPRTLPEVINRDRPQDSPDSRQRASAGAGAEYIDKGWHCPLALPKGQKYPPPEGTTGNHPYPDSADLLDLTSGNVGLRMPSGSFGAEPFEVIGIDVDHYGSKSGAEDLALLCDQYGELPKTWRSTSRGPENPSGIRFFLVPAGQKWKGKPRLDAHRYADIEVIQRTHRYAVVWPSVVGNRRYRWYDAAGSPCDIPAVTDLPILPEPWQQFLRSGSTTRTTTIAHRAPTNGAAADWLTLRGGGRPDAAMRKAAQSLRERMAAGSYDAMTASVWKVVALMAEGHPGGQLTVGKVMAFYLDEHRTRKSGARPTAQLLSELSRATAGAVAHFAEEGDL